jgi:arylformamidase
VKYYDISLPIREGMATWPGDPVVRVTSFKSVDRGDTSNVTALELGTHTGTHLDSPNHIGLEQTIDQLPLETLIGPATVVHSGARELVGMDDLNGVDLSKVRRILFRTANSKRIADGEQFFGDFVAISPEVANTLAAAGVQLVGIDALSVDPKGGAGEAHDVLLNAGVVLLENVNLSDVPPGEYELICLPLKIAGADGAPARVVLRQS